nr:LytTR family DNA-binding domain-containing protein [uncultured Caproiciproducens sp.]
MKLAIHKGSEFSEAEITVNCSKIDVRLERLIRYIKQYTFIFQAKTETGLCFVPAEEIYFIDSVDGKTFLYSKEKVYGYSENLSELESKLIDSAFVRISKSCILNTVYLESVAPLWNHRLEAVLTNGEKLIVARHYIENLKEKMMDWGELK